MQETRPVARTGEKIAGVIAIVAALVVLNGAWENQHTWQNLSWRVAIAAMLLGLAVIVQTSRAGISRARRPGASASRVPDFLRAGATLDNRAADENARADEAVGAGERR